MWVQPLIPRVDIISVYCVPKDTAYALFYALLDNTMNMMLKSGILTLKKKNSTLTANIASCKWSC